MASRKDISPPIEPRSDDAGIHVPHDRLMAAIINELARSRVRHRALLSMLEQRGLISISDYVKQYQKEEQENFHQFIELLLLSPIEFRERWPEWLTKEAERFGYDGSSRSNIQVSLAGNATQPRQPRKRSGPKKKTT